MRTRQGFSKNVSKIVTARDEFDAQIMTKNTFTNIMIVYFNVLRPRMKHRVGSQGNCRIVVTQKNRNVGKRQTKFSKKSTKLGKFSSSGCKCAILSFSGWTWDCGLFLGRPRNWTRTKKDQDASGGFPIRWVTSLICIWEGWKSNRTRINMNPKV